MLQNALLLEKGLSREIICFFIREVQSAPSFLSGNFHPCLDWDVIFDKSFSQILLEQLILLFFSLQLDIFLLNFSQLLLDHFLFLFPSEKDNIQFKIDS